VRTLAAALLAAFVAGPAVALELQAVTPFNEAMMYTIYTNRRVEVMSLIADTTILAKIGDIDSELKEKLPFSADVVLHFAANGDLLAWSDESGTVEVGYWELIGSTVNELCIRFGSFGMTSLCSSPEVEHSDWIVEGTQGNPFGLIAGEPVPMALGTAYLSLRSIAARIE
jgi:hypothetical protein